VEETNEGKNGKVNRAVTAEMSVRVGEIPLSRWNYKIQFLVRQNV
jgi:hypothetical protein